jgi:hypothetical protein
MRKTQSQPSRLDIFESEIKKSPSLNVLHEYNGDNSHKGIEDKLVIEFEGDGPLGIHFVNYYGKMVVCGIKSNTVASEYYDLSENLIVSKVNNYKVCDFGYDNTLQILANIWKMGHEITITFDKDKYYEEVMEFLEECSCIEHYNQFVDLGAKTLIDLEYVEYQDLINMKITKDKRDILSEKLNLITDHE